ncbi:MAG: aminotransferase class III-fold pyridoxal phosphate-dependent enzyme, partial [Gammaproteobacteria bacterium]|nr:aminotransferase class III-fold pyridoxal phosphate-dependent enzyme [Gammaproteobacteria bacterium]
RTPYEKVLHNWPRISPCYAWRHKLEDETEREYGHRVAAELDEAIRMAGPENVAAFIAEPVVGATLGVMPPVPGYFEEIRRICDEHHVLLIADEVMCGSGRCGTFYTHDQENVIPDMVTIAKGLGGGYQPIGAVVARNEIFVTLHGSTETFAHGLTYIGHAIACAAGVAIQKVLDDGLLDSVSGKGEQLLRLLRERFGDHPHVGDIRGRGLFLGIEFVADRKSKTPFPVGDGIPGKLKKAAMENTLICYPGGGTVDGRAGAHILLAPPFIAEEAHFGELADKLDAMFGSVFG